MKRKKESYEIFYSVNLDKFILVCDVEDENCCFKISEEEYNYIFSKEDIGKLDMIANACAVMGSISPRYLCSQNSEKNFTDKQKILADILIQEINTDKSRKYEKF